jgi:thioredoxin 1
MPTLMIFKDGKVVTQHVGALVQKAKLEAWIKQSV